MDLLQKSLSSVISLFKLQSVLSLFFRRHWAKSSVYLNSTFAQSILQKSLSSVISLLKLYRVRSVCCQSLLHKSHSSVISLLKLYRIYTVYSSLNSLKPLKSPNSVFSLLKQIFLKLLCQFWRRTKNKGWNTKCA